MTISFRTALRGSLAAAGLAALATGQSATAATVSTIFNTGVATNNPTTGAPATFTPVTTADAHYTVANLGSTSNPIPAAPATTGFGAAFVLDPTQPPVVYGYPTTATSRNISVAANGIGTGSTFYDYHTTFDLTGFSTVGATLQGLTFADNEVVRIFLNGVDVGFTNNSTAFVTLPFTLTSGFNPTVNTLDFIVNNFTNGGGNPEYTAFNADTLRLNANALPAVPEPGSVAMLIGMSVTGAGFLARRKRAIK